MAPSAWPEPVFPGFPRRVEMAVFLRIYRSLFNGDKRHVKRFPKLKHEPRHAGLKRCVTFLILRRCLDGVKKAA